MDIVFGLIGVIGTFLAIYQTAVLNESKKRKEELQYLLISVGQVAMQKQNGWREKLELLDENDTREMKVAHLQASHDMAQIYSMASTLENVIDSEGSASSRLQERLLRDMKAREEASIS